MTLISCPECLSSISSEAKTYPHCGYPMKSSMPFLNLGKSVLEKSKKIQDTKHDFNWKSIEEEVVNYARSNDYDWALYLSLKITHYPTV